MNGTTLGIGIVARGS